MKWRKLGLVFNANGHSWWMHSHAMIPTPILISDRLIIFLNFCDEKGTARIGYVELDPNNPLRVLDFSKEPVLDIGKDGTFDESGVLQCSIVHVNNRFYLYYVGFELGNKIRYRLLTGLACGTDFKNLFRYKKTPILERSDDELFFRCGPFVVFEDNMFKMWYVAGSEWESINNKAMPVYTINYIESRDGINWPDKGQVCIKIESENEHGFGRPYVIRHGNKLKMFYSIRVKHLGYRLGYAESFDGVSWVRKDLMVGITVSEDSSFDNEMICYSSILNLNNKIYMFYNGNSFGKTGFGLAELVQDD